MYARLHTSWPFATVLPGEVQRANPPYNTAHVLYLIKFCSRTSTPHPSLALALLPTQDQRSMLHKHATSYMRIPMAPTDAHAALKCFSLPHVVPWLLLTLSHISASHVASRALAFQR